MNALEIAGENVANLATQWWEEDIFDPRVSDVSAEGKRCKETISVFTKACNWGAYKGNGTGVEWCGMFAFTCWAQAGGLDPKWLASYSQSTYRNQLWATYKNWSKTSLNPKPTNVKYADDLRKYVDLRKKGSFVPRTGDIVIVGDGTPSYGDHITILLGYDEKTGDYDTISGNGGGVGPKGNSREGISRRTYSSKKGSYKPMWLIRPAFGDLLAERP